jgi:hypothetical protein
VIFDPEAVGDGAGVLIEAGLESGHSPAEILGSGMTVMIGDILAEPSHTTIRLSLDHLAWSRRRVSTVCSPLARARPKPHLSFVVEIESVEGQLVQQTRRARGNSEAPAAFGPAIAEIGILVDAGFVQLDQQMAVVLGACQQIANLLEIGLPALRVGPTEQLSGLLSGKLQAMLGGADGMVSRQQVRPNRLRTQPTRRRSAQRGGGSAPATSTGGAASERWAVRTVSPRPATMASRSSPESLHYDLLKTIIFSSVISRIVNGIPPVPYPDW